MSSYWNEGVIKLHPSSKWRESLVPAAAVTPAPRAYIYVVAVKKFVVDFRDTRGVFHWSEARLDVIIFSLHVAGH